MNMVKVWFCPALLWNTSVIFTPKKSTTAYLLKLVYLK